MNKSIQVRVLYSQGCPNASAVTDLIGKIAREIGASVDVEQVLVTTPAQAVELRCLGSPTIQVNTVDIEPEARGSMAFGLG